MASVLLVDDDPNILDTVKDILEDAGYSVQTAGTMAGALKQIRSQAPDIVIIDMHLPDGTGLELAPRVAAVAPHAKIILMTGEAQVDLTGAHGSIVDYLVKPVDPRQLLELLLRHVNSR